MTMYGVAGGSASSPMTACAFLKNIFCVGLIFGSVLLPPSAAFAGEPAWWTKMKQDCLDSGGQLSSRYVNSWTGCINGNRPGNPGDGGAESRAQEAAEARRLAEEQRKREAELEQQRRDADERHRQEETTRQAKFIEGRNEAVKTLRGSSDIRVTPNAPGGTELRGSAADTGIRSLKPVMEVRNPGGKQAAWKQLHCAVSISRYALGALDKTGDDQEFGVLSVEALKALDGGRPGVECPAADPMPDLQGRAVDMEHLKGEERKILERAAVIAGRMKQSREKATNPSVPSPVPANETEMEKMRRVQKELNRINSGDKLHGDQKEIDEQEKNRKELAQLILENEKLTSVTFSTTPEAPSGRRRKPVEPPSPGGEK